MKIRNSVVFITGANRGLGRAFAAGAVLRGAHKVYACVRDPQAPVPEGCVKVVLDVTQEDSVYELGDRLKDVSVVVQNAGILRPGNPLERESDADLRAQFETNVLGALYVARAFAPALVANAGGMLAMLSAGTWTAHPALGSYAASKAAAWGLMNNLRSVLGPQGVTVTAVHAGFVDTDMAKGFPGPKIPPSEVVDASFEGLESGKLEVLVDPFCRALKASLSTERAAYLGHTADSGATPM